MTNGIWIYSVRFVEGNAELTLLFSVLDPGLIDEVSNPVLESMLVSDVNSLMHRLAFLKERWDVSLLSGSKHSFTLFASCDVSKLVESLPDFVINLN